MTAKELMQSEIDDVGGQFERLLVGIPADKADVRLHGDAFSMREHLIHLCEVYQAVATKASGGTHEWGSYAPPDSEWQPLQETFHSLRAKAREAVLAGDGDFEQGPGFIVGHDNYHVGQMVTLRISFDPSWNSFGIYGE